MSSRELEALVEQLRRGNIPPGAEIVKENRVRLAVRAEDWLIKLFRERKANAKREARALEEATKRGVRVPRLVASGADWLATRWIHGRLAEPRDLEQILDDVRAMHAAGMLHGDLHLANLLIADGVLWITDLQRSRFLPWIPAPLRNRELGWLAASIGEPLPAPLEQVRFWYHVRTQRHWRSRTKRCLVESGSFSRFEALGYRGFRRREVEAQALRSVLEALSANEARERDADNQVERRAGWVVKRHASEQAARAAWVAGCGLEARGITTGRALAWVGPWLVMEDAGETLSNWVDAAFGDASGATREELAEAVAHLLARLHRRGIYHTDLKAGNICWTPGALPRLIDYARVRFGRSVRRRRRIKNLAQVNASVPDLVPAELRERTLQVYLEATQTSAHARPIRARVVRESLRRDHRWSGC